MAAATPDREVEMANYSSSPALSSLLSDSPSEPGSPSRSDQHVGHKTDEIVVDPVSAPRFPQTQLQPQPHLQSKQYTLDGVRLTKDGLPRKKPGRKPGTTVMKKAGDGTPPASSGTAAGSGVEVVKPKRARKPRDPNAPPVQRKKRAQPAYAPGSEASTPRSVSATQYQPKLELTSMRMDIDPRPKSSSATSVPVAVHQPPRQPPLTIVDKLAKREAIQNILNSDDPPPRPPPVSAMVAPARSSGQNFDPVRSAFDPVRENMYTRDPYGTGPLGSPRASTQMANGASASPSIACLVDPPVSISRSPAATSSVLHLTSPPTYNKATVVTQSSRYRDSIPSAPPSPSPTPAVLNVLYLTAPQPAVTGNKQKTSAQPPVPPVQSANPALTLTSKPTSTKPAAQKSETCGTKSHSKAPPPPPASAAAKASSKASTTKSAASKASKTAATTNTSSSAAATENANANVPKAIGPATSSFRDVAMTGTSTTAPAPVSVPLIKKFSSILQHDKGSKQNRSATSAASSPKLSAANDPATPPSTALDSGSASTADEPERSILDFGKARPGEELSAPSIVLRIPLVQGENNKYVNFMRMAEDRYGWDALHPRLAAHRDRKARIAAAASALERNGSGRESGDEMTDDMQSGDEGSNDENADIGNITFNGNGAGSDATPAKPVRKKRIFKEDEYDKDDGFVDDSEMLWEEQAAASRDGFFVYSGPLVPEEEKPDEGSAPPAKRGRGGRGSRGGTGRTTTARATGGRSAGGTGRGTTTTTRKPRATKLEKEQREREKADNDKAKEAKDLSASKSSGPNNTAGLTSSFAAGIAVDA